MTVKRVLDYAVGAEELHNEHVFQWLCEMLADVNVDVCSDFPLIVADDGSYAVTITARPKAKAD